MKSICKYIYNQRSPPEILRQLESLKKVSIGKICLGKPEAGLIYDLLSLLPAGIHIDDINLLQSYQTKTKTKDRDYAYLLNFLLKRDLVIREGDVYKLSDFECDIAERNNTVYNEKTHIVTLFLSHKLDWWID